MVYQTDYKDVNVFKKGKVRDVYEIDDNLLLIATDRISCFDYILPTPIPNKGKILTKISLFWFSFLKDVVENHLISSHVEDLPPALSEHRDDLIGRIMIAKKCEVIPFECVVRGYISGSGWKEYQQKGSVCEIKLPEGLKQSDKLESPIFTPATKADAGHDENVGFDYMASQIGLGLAEQLRDLSIAIYKKAAEYADSKGIIIADTKFEFGLFNGKVILVDEVLTPDSSRFWPKSTYSPGGPQASFDKQFVRDYLESINWDKQPPAPELPDEIVSKTEDKYREALNLLKS
ncbi:MAG: phosphoribosylaminoimidazolesuccinocarboxamide synthase [Candidatus Omnitrophica bacterium]|nr:phosphoribosylaminoimidazolesuccinocarboxamide synthase [Candidatus Omnitrophota bacterium]